jgi:hypothetical protein
VALSSFFAGAVWTGSWYCDRNILKLHNSENENHSCFSMATMNWYFMLLTAMCRSTTIKINASLVLYRKNN